MNAVRLRRLRADYEAVRRLVRLHPRIRIDGVHGNPPDRYRLKLFVRSLQERGGQVVPRSDHDLEVLLPQGYPRDAPLFQFLAAGKRSVVGAPGDPHVEALVSSADLVVESFQPDDRLEAARRVERHPGLVVLSITPFGRTGPYAGRPATEFTVQAESGSIATRGLASQPPIMAGGRTTEWVGGTFAAVAALAAVRRARAHGLGEHVEDRVG